MNRSKLVLRVRSDLVGRSEPDDKAGGKKGPRTVLMECLCSGIGRPVNFQNCGSTRVDREPDAFPWVSCRRHSGFGFARFVPPSIMGRRRLILLLLTSALSIGAALVFLRDRRREPEYNGL